MLGQHRRDRREPMAHYPLRAGLLALLAVVPASSRPMAVVPASSRPQADAPAWPSYQGNAQRSGAVTHGPQGPLTLAWTHHPAAAPRPSWDAPASGSLWQKLDHLEARVSFDHTFPVVAAGERLFYASSADNQVHCLDAADGSEVWSYFAEAPVRLAPVLVGERLVFGADDGFVYCLQQSDGELLWRRRIAPRERRIPSNGQLISAWPVRTGVVSDGRQVYATCGLFPTYGCWATALDLEHGEVVWRVKLEQAVSPQGYLLLGRDRLYVPSGRTTPFALDLADGSFLGQFGGPGGSYALVAGEDLVSGPGNQGELALAGGHSRDRIASFQGRRMVVGPLLSYLQTATSLSALDRNKFTLLQQGRIECEKRRQAATSDEERAQYDEELAAIARAAKACILWSVPCGHADALILAGTRLYAAGSGELAAYDPADGALLWSTPCPGRVRELAATPTKVFAADESGAIHAFDTHAVESRADAPAAGLAVILKRVATAASQHPQWSAWLAQSAGMVVLSGVGADGQGLWPWLKPASGARGPLLSDRRRLVVLTSAETAPGLRRLVRQLLPLGYQVQLIPEDLTPDLVPDFANLVITTSPIPPAQAVELRSRFGPLLQPGRGALLWREITPPQSRRLETGASGESVADRHWLRPSQEGAGQWSHAYASAGNSACSEDRLVDEELELQWFGGPGAAAMVDRHLRTAPPVSRAGRLFLPANDELIAVDAYNGTSLWRRSLPGWSRTGMPFDGGYLLVGDDEVMTALPGAAVAFDAASGAPTRRFELPPADWLDHPQPMEWGWLAQQGGMLYGSGTAVGAARRQQSLDAVVEQYGEARPLVCSLVLQGFALARCQEDSNQADWWYESPGVILNTSLAADQGRVFFLEAGTTTARHASGRATLAQLSAGAGMEMVALDGNTGAELWRVPWPDAGERHIVYLCAANGVLVSVGSFNREDRVWYVVRCWSADSGTLLWQREHGNNRPGVGGDHGEQVHHPVIQGDRVIAEPAVYRLADGERLDHADQGDFVVPRRGGCGTLSASAGSVYFRNSCPTVRLVDGPRGSARKLTESTRPGCWISILPVGGLVLLPEASSGCVCAYPVQTSMALRPRQ